MKEELISVIVPIYNVEKYIRKCIDSIIKQEYKNLEIILVDDGSPDKCGEICDEYAKIDERIKVVHKANGGLSDARNVGIKCSNGEYIGFVDSDDYIEKDMYKVLFFNMLQHNADISICKYRKIYENKKSKKIIYDNIDVKVFDGEEKIKELLLGKNISDHAMNKLYKKNVFNNVEFRKGYKFEDIDIMYKLFENSDRIVLTEYIGYNYLQRENSIINSMDTRATLDLIEVVKDRYNYYKNNKMLSEINKFRRAKFAYRYHILMARIKSHEYDSNIMKNEYTFFKTSYKIIKKNDMESKFYDKILMKVLFIDRHMFYILINIIYKLKKG